MKASDGSEWARAALVAVAFMVAVASLTMLLCGCAAGEASETKAEESKYAYPCPLDAHTYDAPVWWPECREVKEVCDPRTNQKWWVLRISNGKEYGVDMVQYVVLPVEPAGGDLS